MSLIVFAWSFRSVVRSLTIWILKSARMKDVEKSVRGRVVLIGRFIPNLHCEHARTISVSQILELLCTHAKRCTEYDNLV
ncbi:hypothetical protein GYMLUDRAFT_91811 [Collybiopsis luxurians FD-317 M1]|nr:hypothetical protein GYMLUDRAFT_91811 [Collybiopsis luxurians FD-317 M1]